MASVETALPSPKRTQIRTERMRQYLDNHGDAVHISPSRLLTCPHEGCCKVLTSSPGLRYHMKSHDACARPYECCKCQKTFKSSNGLKYHIEKTKCELPSPGNDDLPSPKMSPVPISMTTMQSILKKEPLNERFKVIDEKRPMYKSVERQNIPAPLSIRVDNASASDLDPESETEDRSQVNWLTELAIIATGPQSPLMQRTTPQRSPIKASRSPQKTFLYQSLHSYAKPPRSPTPEDKCQYKAARRIHVELGEDESDTHVTSSSPFPSSPSADFEHSGSWSHSWPTARWQCFVQGTRLKFSAGANNYWQPVEEIAQTELLTSKASQDRVEKQTNNYAPNGLRILTINEMNSDDSLRIRFTPGISDNPEVTAECTNDHPFFVKGKGWSSFRPRLTLEHYGIPCTELEVNDVCLPPSHPDAKYTTDVFDSLTKSYDFTLEDSSAVLALSNMAKMRSNQDMSPKSSPTASPSKRRSRGDPDKPKRPMNAFMLFAKKFRVEYTQMYPGKDNRAISVLLGERWKGLKNEERKMYTTEAKSLAEKYKKSHPDCWKRKRTSSCKSTD